MLLLRGAHLLQHSSTVQEVLGLSSAESEYYALTRGACVALGLQSHVAVWQLPSEISLHTDSSSARAVAMRRGVGKNTRHIKTPFALVVGTRGGEALASEKVSHCESHSREPGRLRHFQKQKPENCAEQSNRFGSALKPQRRSLDLLAKVSSRGLKRRRKESSTPLGRRDL
eukprot:5841684-Amphidinium_carterae.1